MANTYRKAGDVLQLELQLGDGAAFPTTRVFSKVVDTAGATLIAEFELTNVGDGYYSDAVQVMPNNTSVKIFYYIRLVDGVTPSLNYNPNVASEIFVRDFVAELVVENLDIMLSGLRNTDIEGSASADSGLGGSLTDEMLIGTIETDTIIEGVADEC